MHTILDQIRYLVIFFITPTFHSYQKIMIWVKMYFWQRTFGGKDTGPQWNISFGLNYHALVQNAVIFRGVVVIRLAERIHLKQYHFMYDSVFSIFTAHEINLGMSFPASRHRLRLQKIIRRKTETSGRVSQAGRPDPAEGSDRDTGNEKSSKEAFPIFHALPWRGWTSKLGLVLNLGSVRTSVIRSWNKSCPIFFSKEATSVLL